MSLLQRLLRLSPSVKEATVSILGPSKAGKTTLIQFLETGVPPNEEPLSTLGIDFRKKPIAIGKWKLKLIDVGGQKAYQDAFWDFAVEQSDGIIYVIDATIKPETSPEVFAHHLAQFRYVLEIAGNDTPLMILLNKQDLVEYDPIVPETFSQYYPLDLLKGTTCAFMPTSAKYGVGVEEAFKWFIEAVNKSMNM